MRNVAVSALILDVERGVACFALSIIEGARATVSKANRDLFPIFIGRNNVEFGRKEGQQRDQEEKMKWVY